MATKRKSKKEAVNLVKVDTPTLIDINQSVVYDKCEWCFQFDDDSPFVFAASTSDSDEVPAVKFNITNTSDSTVEFAFNGKRFKLFARELTDIGERIIQNNK
jgi:hypothetical protein